MLSRDVRYSWFSAFKLQGPKKLGNFDDYIEKVIIRNNAELNVFYDYLALYRKIENKRAICYWGQNNEVGFCFIRLGTSLYR